MPKMCSIAIVLATATLALAQPADQQERSEATGPREAFLVLPDGQATGFRGFERQVSADFGKAAGGDERARLRVLEACDRAIKADASNAEAIAWRGAVRMLEAGSASQAGDYMAAMNHVNAALADIDSARELEPSNPGVRVVAARMLLNLARNHPVKSMAEGYAKRGIGDAIAGLEALHAHWAQQPASVKGELLLGVAQAYDALGEPAKARDWFNRVIGAVPGTAWAGQAQDWLDAADRRAKSF